MFIVSRFILILLVILYSTPGFSIEPMKIDVVHAAPSSSTEKILEMTTESNKKLKHLSDDELEWYNKFQDGLGLFDGWRDISEKILVCLPNEDQEGVKDILHDMGVRIGSEWSKDNKIRKIDTKQLRSWGKRLKKARDEGTEDLKKTVDIISKEVDAILEQEQASTSLKTE